ncbi:MAG: RNA polymerase sigma factor [Bryobacteraceae bacterium]
MSTWELTLDAIPNDAAATTRKLDRFEAVVVANERRLLALAYRLLGSTDAARDAVQEVFLKLFRHWDRVEADPAAWLYRVTVNECFDHRKRTRPWVELGAIPASTNLEAGAAIEEQRRMLLEELHRLPERERMAVVLREIEGFTTAEAAALMGSEEVTVRSQISSARAKLKAAISVRLERRKR